MSHYDQYRSYHEAPAPSDRAVGLALAAALAVIGLFPLWRGRGVRGWALGAAAVLLALSLLRPAWLKPVVRLWLKFAHLVSRLINFVVLAALFYLVATPLALAMRLLGKDHLRLRAAAPTWWIERRPPGPARESMIEQF